MNRKRVFLALPLEPVEPVAAKMKQMQYRLHNYHIKWVKPEYFHLTLFFFGEIPVNQIPELSELVGSTLTNLSPFSFSVTGQAIFKKGNEPRVVWLGINAPEQLLDLKKAIDKSVESLGFISDEKRFRPHLTLGRFLPKQRVNTDLESALKEGELMEPLNYDASKVILFESKLLPTGAQYLPIEVFSIGPKV